jgi:hypothetical protein
VGDSGDDVVGFVAVEFDPGDPDRGERLLDHAEGLDGGVVGVGAVGLVARVAGLAALCGALAVEDDDDFVVGAISR